MTLAFFTKDLRLAARGGGILPALPAMLLLQAGLFAVYGVWAILEGPNAGFPVASLGGWMATLALYMAAFMSTTQAAVAMGTETSPDVAESLASAPVRPWNFFAGKAALPLIQGIATQLALLPTWAYLVGRGLVSPSGAARALLALVAIVPAGAMLGAARYRMLSLVASRRVQFEARTGRRLGTAASASSAQQMLFLMVLMFSTSGAFRGLNTAALATGTPASNPFLRALDAARPLLPPSLVKSGDPVSFFGFGVHPSAFTLVLLAGFAALSMAGAVLHHPRTEGRERRFARQALLAARAAFVLYLLGAFWVEGPALACAISGTAALLWAVMGVPMEEDRRGAASAAATSCLAPAALALALAGTPGILFWGGCTVICAAAAASIPPARAGRLADGARGDRRVLAIFAILIAGVGAPIAALWLREFPLWAPVAIVAGAASCFSLPAAVIALAHSTLGPIPTWLDVAAQIPALQRFPPWIGAPLLFGTVAAIAIWRGRAISTRANLG